MRRTCGFAIPFAKEAAKKQPVPTATPSRVICSWIIPLLALALAGPAPASPKTHVRLLLSADSAPAGQTIWAGLKMEMPPTWHVYWRNGGDAGDPVRIKWTLPEGVSAGPTTAPAAKRG